MQPESVQDLFSRVASSQPRDVAVDRVSRRITYGDLESRSNRLANALLSAGLKRSQLVTILAQDPIEVIVSILGVLKAGGVFVPFDPGFPAQRLEVMARQVEPGWYVAEPRFLDRVEALRNGNGGRVFALDGGELEKAEASRPEVASSPDDPCSIYFTSGSTGKPKAILGRLKGIAHFARWEAEALGVKRGTRVSQLASPSFDGFLKDAFVPLCAGGTVCAPESRSVVLEPGRLIDWVDVEGVEVLHVVPSVLRAILNEKLDAKYFGELKWVVLAGEALLPADVRRWREIFGDRVRLVNLYGPTETTVTKLFHFVESADAERPSVPIGKPMPGAAAMILSSTLQPCRPGAVGEIVIRTPYRALGYFGDPELTREAFVPNPFGKDPDDLVYRTGDFGRLLEDGSFEFLGRRDHQVKIRGVRVELPEIESLLRSHPGVKDVAVIDREAPDGTKYLCAYLVLAEGTATGELREHLSSQLPELMMPSAFVEMAELPRTLNGKIDRKALPTLDQVQAGKREQEDTRPRTPVEEIVAGIWSEVLRLPRVGLADNFFELGGHSLLATQIISRVRESLGVELPLRVLFEAPTVAELAARIERESGAGAESAPIRPAPREGDLPLSYSQQRLWFLEQLAPGNSAFHIPLGMRLRGRLEVAALAATFAEVARRHEILRTTFPVRDGLPVQLVGAAAEVPLPQVDLSGLGEWREAEARRLAAEHAVRPFDLEAGPLVRTLLLRLEEQDHVLVCVMHHAVSDGWSRGVLIREVSVLYAALLEGRPSPLPELPIQYADFAVWQRQWLQESLAPALEHWRERLAGAPPVHQLPTDRPRPPVQTYAGTQEPVRLSPALSERLNALARRAGVTLFMALLAAFCGLLRRYTGQDDHVVGTSVAGRTRPEIEGLIGFFVNMLPLRADASGDPAFDDLLKRVREVTLEAFARQDLPFEAMVEALQPERNLSYPPLFQVALTLQNAPVSELALPGLALSFPEIEEIAAKYDLLLDLWEGNEGVAGALEINTDLFDRATGRRLVRHFENLLAGAVTSPERRLSELPLLDEAEWLQAVVETNRSEAGYSRNLCIHELIERQAAESPGSVAVICGQESLTCRELDRRANQMAHYLARLGIGPGDLVGLCLDHSLEEVISLLGVLKAGAGYVPLDPRHPPRRLLSALADSGARAVLTQERLAPSLLESGLALIRLDADALAIAREKTSPLGQRATPRDIAYVIYTSGSTGEPKGVAIQHQALENYIEWACEVYLQGESAGLPLYSSLTFDLTVTSIFISLATCNPLIVFSPEEEEPPLRAILDDGRVSILKLTPSHLALIKDQDNRRSAVRRLIVGGEALATRLAREAHDSFGGRVEIYNEYGPTETTVGCMIHRFNPAAIERPFVPIGRPAANAQVYVLDPWLNPVPENVTGELYVAGDGLALGYLNRPDLTAERFLPSPFAPGRRMYRAGDLARRLPGGALDFVGRADRQVKLRGFRIEPGEIETALGGHPSVRDCAVLLREDVPGEHRLVAYFVAAGGPPSTSELRRFLEERLPRFMVPAVFLPLEAMPVTPNGKVDRRALPAPDGGRPSLESAYAAPETEMEQAIAGIWKGVLRLQEVGLYDNFFHLGGQSILATQVIQRINQRFRVSLPIRAIFGESTVAGLSVLVEEALIERLEAEP